MSVAIDTTSEVDKDAYDEEFDENHTVHGQKVSTCTYIPGCYGACYTCRSEQ